MSNVQVLRIVEKLETCFSGEPWYGHSVLAKLSGVSAPIAEQYLPNYSKNVAELVMHMIAWREFALRKLMGDAEFKIELNSEADWPKAKSLSNQTWNDLMADLKRTQSDLLKVLSERDDLFLKSKVPGELYTFEYLLTGITEHDTYHLGQIAMILSILK
ncbi:MAG: hypothetical protein CML05_04755 [Pseudozobellia sp.]|nr:hypothetical protein [Pseudozobellia sp.]|tara:strand:+ start:431 stop:907 length:477 start_codon:yes stop_codon:yes gene_type:complete